MPVGDSAKAFERVRLEVVWRCGRHFGFPQKVMMIEHQGRVWFEGCVADPLQTTAMCRLGQNGRCSFWEESCKKQVRSCISPFVPETKVSVDAIKFHLWGKNRVLPEVTMKVFEKLKEKVTKEGLVLSLNER